MTICVRHRSASGQLDDEYWEYRRVDHRIDVTLRSGLLRIRFEVKVCSQEKPDFGAHPIVRVDNESWRVLPARFVRCWRHRIEALAAISCPIGDILSPGQHLVLTNAPPHVSAELEVL